MAEEKKVTKEVKEAPKAAHKSSVTIPEKEIGTNSLQLPFPKDPHGLNAALRRGGIKAAASVKGDKAKLKALLETLEVIAGHAKAKYLKDFEARKVAKENSISARARVAEKLKRQAEAKAAEYEAAAKRVRAEAGIVEEVETSKED